MTDDELMQQTRRMAAEGLQDDDPTAWFDRLYAAARDGKAAVPWDRGGPHPLLLGWIAQTKPRGVGRRCLVVGSGLGDDAELLATLGYDTVAFDISAAAIATTQARYPDSAVAYAVASLFELPREWLAAFDFVYECLTVQSMPESMRADAMAAVGSTVAPGGRLLAIASARDDDEPVDGPPWPLTRGDIDAYAGDTLRAVGVEHLEAAIGPTTWMWRALYERSV